MKNKKEIYSFDVQVDEGKEAPSDDSKKTEVEKTCYRIFICKPSRRQVEDAEIEYSIEISSCLRQGILTKAMVLKKYDELTGSDQHRLKRDLQYLSEISTNYSMKFQKLQEMKIGKKIEHLDKNKAYRELSSELVDLRKEIVRVETEYSSLFDFTADNKAANRQILWYLSNLTYYCKDGEEEWHQLIPGETWEKKRDYLYDQEENPDNKLFHASFEKALTFVSLWFHSISPTTEDFDELNKEFENLNA